MHFLLGFQLGYTKHLTNSGDCPADLSRGEHGLDDSWRVNYADFNDIHYQSYRPIARDVIIKITGNIQETGSHVGVPLIGVSTFYMAISANIVPLALQVFTGQNQVRPVL